MEPDVGQLLFVDLDSHVARSKDASLCGGVPIGRVTEETCRKLRPLSVDGDASHDRGHNRCGEARILLDVDRTLNVFLIVFNNLFH